MSAPVLSWLFTVQGTPKHSSHVSPRRTRVHHPPGASGSLGSARPSGKGSLHPTLRANPFPEVTDLFCRLPLSTLFYRPEASNLGDLMRLWVRPGVRIISPSDFQGPSRAHRTPRMTECFTSRKTLSPGKPNFRVVGC